MGVKRMGTMNRISPAMPSWWPLSDEPTDEDQLGFKSYCGRVAEGLKRCGSEGRVLTVGVYGKWGSGKTSFLKMLGRELDGSYTIVWFDAWQYSRREELWVALLRRILAVIEKEHGKAKALRLRLQVWYDIKKKGLLPALAEALWPMAWKALLVMLWLTVTGCLGLAVLAGLVAAGVWRWIVGSTISLAPLIVFSLLVKRGLDAILNSQLGVKLDQLMGESSYASFIAFIDEFSRDFNDLVREVGQERPLVILIDDLDRCQPDEIVPVLEAIKLLTRQEQSAQGTQHDQKQGGLAFVLAMDRDVMEQAIEVQYKDFVQVGPNTEADKLVSGQQYLEKIVQLPVPLPPLTSVSARDFIEQLVDDDETNRYLDLFASGLEPTTPRQIKRVLNVFAYHRSTHPELQAELLAKLAVIQSKWREIYNKWATYPALLGDLESFAEVMTEKEPDLSSRFALPAPDGVKRLVEQFGRWKGLANLLLWRQKQRVSFGSIDPMQYLISETGGTEPMGVAQIWPALLSGDETKARSALQTLLGIGEKLGREEKERLFATWLLDHLNSDDALKRERAIVALAEMALPEAVSPLMKIAADRNVVARLRHRAVHALGRIGLADPRTPGLLGQLLSDGSEDLIVRLIAADALSNSEVRTAELDRSTTRDFLSDLLNIVEPPLPGQPRAEPLLLDWRVRRLLGRLSNRDDTAIDRVIDWIFRASPADQRRRWEVVADILRRVEARRLTHRLVINMVERHPDHRAEIEEILWAIGGEAAVAGLIVLTQDRRAEFSHRASAIELLGRIGGDQIVEPLIALLRDDPSALIRSAATRALGEMATRGHEDALQAVLDHALTDPDQTVRSQVATALPHTPPPLCHLLSEALHDKARDSEVRHVLIDTLGTIGDNTAIAALKQVATDETEDEAVRRHAWRTLIPVLEQVIRDKTKDTPDRLHAVQTLTAAPEQVIGDETGDEVLRLHAMQTLTGALERVIEDETDDEMIHLHARRALESLRASSRQTA